MTAAMRTSATTTMRMMRIVLIASKYPRRTGA